MGNHIFSHKGTFFAPVRWGHPSLNGQRSKMCPRPVSKQIKSDTFRSPFAPARWRCPYDQYKSKDYIVVMTFYIETKKVYLLSRKKRIFGEILHILLHHVIITKYIKAGQNIALSALESLYHLQCATVIRSVSSLSNRTVQQTWP